MIKFVTWSRGVQNRRDGPFATRRLRRRGGRRSSGVKRFGVFAPCRVEVRVPTKDLMLRYEELEVFSGFSSPLSATW